MTNQAHESSGREQRLQEALVAGIEAAETGGTENRDAVLGRPPFQAATALDTLLQVLDQDPAPPRQLNRSIPRDLETICLKCLEKEPSKRYASARDFIADLDRFLTGQPIDARPTSRRERIAKWIRRRPAAAALLGVSAAAAIGFVALGIALLVNAQQLANEATKRESAERDRGDLLRKQTELLTAQVTEGRSHAYSSDVVLAGLSLDRNDAAGAQRYLDSTRPKPGETDLRGFEWHYLWRKNNLERLNLPKTGLVAMPPVYPQRDRKHAQRRQLAYSPDGKFLASTRDVCGRPGETGRHRADLRGSIVGHSLTGKCAEMSPAFCGIVG